MAEWTVTASHAVGIQRFGVGNRQQQVDGAADENGGFIRGLGRRGRGVAQQRANKQQRYRFFYVIRSHRSFHQHGGKPAQQNYSGQAPCTGIMTPLSNQRVWLSLERFPGGPGEEPQISPKLWHCGKLWKGRPRPWDSQSRRSRFLLRTISPGEVAN